MPSEDEEVEGHHHNDDEQPPTWKLFQSSFSSNISLESNADPVAGS